MENLEEFRLQVIFDNIRHTLITSKTPLSPTSKAYLKEGLAFLDQLIRSLDTLGVDIYQSDITGVFQFVPNLKDVIEITESLTTPLNREKLNSLKNYFTQIREQLADFDLNPRQILQGAGLDRPPRFL